MPFSAHGRPYSINQASGLRHISNFDAYSKRSRFLKHRNPDYSFFSMPFRKKNHQSNESRIPFRHKEGTVTSANDFANAAVPVVISDMI